ncbi:MAG: sporulation integral membrane protein YtvI [Anaerovoracaceae bacterium]
MDYEKKKRFIVNLLYGGLIILIVYVAIHYGLGMIAPFLLGFLIAYALKRPAKFIARKTRLPYKPVVMLLVLLFYGTVGVLISLLGIKLVTSSIDLVSDLPTIYKVEIEPALNAFFDSIEQMIFKMDPALVSTISEMFAQFIQSVGQLLTDLSVKAVSALSGYASSLPGLFIRLLFMIISTFFIAGDYDMLVGFASRQLSDNTRSLLTKIKEYVVGTLFVCIRSYALIMTITFIELSIGLSIIRLPNAILIALVISIFDILPVLGTGGVMIPWAVITAIQGDYTLAIELIVIYLIITVVRNFIEPKIVGSQIGLHPVVTLASMFVGAQLFGIIGLFGFPILLSLLRHLNDNGTIKLFK